MTQNFHNIDDAYVTIRMIRKNKQLTQKEVAGEIPLATYRRIEAGKSQPTLKNFVHIVDNLRMYDMAEFMLIHENFKVDRRQEILQLFKEMKTTLNSQGFKNFFESCSEYLESNHDPEIENLYQSLQGLYKYSHTNNHEEGYKLIEPLWLSLRDKENLFYWDALALTSILSLLKNPEDIHLQVPRLIKAFTQFEHHYETKRPIVKVYLNAAFCLKMNQKMMEGEDYVDKALALSNELQDMPLYYDTLYKKAEMEYVKGNQAVAFRLANESFDGLERFEVEKGKDSILNDNRADWLILTQKKS